MRYNTSAGRLYAALRTVRNHPVLKQNYGKERKTNEKHKNPLYRHRGAGRGVYALLTYLSLAFNLAYGPVQFRLSEALTLLPVVSGAAVPGLAVGCLLGNLTSPYGLVDIVCGTCASLLAAVGARLFARVRLRGIPVVSLLMPIVCNAVVVGAEITFLAPEGFALPAFLSAAASVAAGEAAVVVLLGLPLLLLAEKAGLGLLSGAEK